MYTYQTIHVYTASSVVYGCNCTDYVDRRRFGFGNCKKKSRSKSHFPFPGKDTCYVYLPSSCPDLVNSPVDNKEYPEKKISAEACEADPNIAGRTISMYT